MKDIFGNEIGAVNDIQITQPVVALEVPRYEYAKLVRNSERLVIIKKLASKMDSYALKSVCEVLFSEAEDE